MAESGRIGINGPTWVLQTSGDDTGLLTITPSGGDLTWNDTLSPWNTYRSIINSVKIEGQIQVADSANGLFSDLDRVTSFSGLYHLNMVKNGEVVQMIDMFRKSSIIKGYGVLGTSFWTVQVKQEVGFLEIGAGEFEWQGLIKIPVGLQGEIQEIPTSPWDDYRIYIHKINIMGKLTIKNSARNLFYFLNRATEITGLDLVETINLTDIGGMFRNMWTLKSVDLSTFDTTLVTDMSFIFSNTWNLIEITFPHPPTGIWSTSNVTTMESMFFNAKSLPSIDVSQKGLDVSGWNTSKVTNMSSMFYCAYNLTYLNVAASDDGLIWDTSKVTDMSFMFFQCGVRQSAPPYDLDVSKWKIAIAQMTWMFYRDKPRENPVIPYDPDNPATHQWESDPIKVDLTNWIPQWWDAEFYGFYACKANMFELGSIEVLNEFDIIQITTPLSPPGLTYPDCEDYTSADCATIDVPYPRT